MGRIGVVLVLAAVLGCAARGTADYRARPVRPEQDWGDRLHLERRGVRVLVGPPAVYPYVRESAPGEGEAGRYELFTRVVVENVGLDALEVLWAGAYLEGPTGERVGLVDVREAAGRRGRGGEVGPAPVERLDPGARAVRALIPETFYRIEVNEPMVLLCDRCEYRLVLRVRRAGREERLDLPFVLWRRSHPVRGSRKPWTGGS